MAGTTPTLADLVDLEFHLVRLEQGAVEVEEATKALSPELGDRELAQAWLERLRRRGAASPGARVELGLRLVGVLATVVGTLLGATACAGALAWDGVEPINLWRFLGGLVLLQVLLLAALVAVLVLWRRRAGAWLSLLQRGLRTVARSRWVDRLLGWRAGHDDHDRQAEWIAATHRLRGRHALYTEAESWLLMRLTQRFGVFFNLGAVFTFLGLVLFTDLAFAWSTTPAEIDGGHLAALCRALGAPWEWTGLDLVPSPEQIEATRWSRLDHRFADPTLGPTAAAAWWPFLLAAVCVWGLLPRLLAWAYARHRYHRCLRRVSFDHAGFRALRNRVEAATASAWTGPAPEQLQADLLPLAETPAASPTRVQEHAGAAVVIWGDWPIGDGEVMELLHHHGRWAGAHLHRAGGAAEEPTRALLAWVKEHQPPAVVFLVEAAESPDKRLRRLLHSLREHLGATSPILVVATARRDHTWTDPLERELRLWRHALAALADPYLQVEAWTA